MTAFGEEESVASSRQTNGNDLNITSIGQLGKFSKRVEVIDEILSKSRPIS